MGASVSTVKRMIAAGDLSWHEAPGGLRRLDREEIDGLFVRAKDVSPQRKVVTDEEFRRFVCVAN
jgi:excisionase family DNA binding protein